MHQESGQLVFDERVDDGRGRVRGKERYNAWPCLLPPVGECFPLSSLPSPPPRHPGFPSPRWRNNVSRRCQGEPPPVAIGVPSNIRRRVSLVTDRPLFINGELVSTFTHARIPAITHHHHARAGVSRGSRRGALPATAPQNSPRVHRQGHHRIASRNR